MRRAIRWVGAGVGVIVLATVAAVGWLAATESGMRWTLARAVSASGGSLRWNSAQGSLMGGLQITGLVFETSAANLTLQQIRLAWQPWQLLGAALVLDAVDIRGLRYAASGDAGEPLTPAALQALLFSLPVTLEINALQGDDLTLASADGGFTLEHVSAAVELDGEHLQLAGIELRQGSNSVSGDVSLTSELQLDAALAWNAALQQRELAGMLTLGGTLQRMELQHQLTAPLVLSSNGSVVPGLFDGEALALDLQHTAALQNLAAVDQPELSVGGAVTTRGTPAELAISGSLDIQQSGFTPLVANLDLQYRNGGVDINLLTLDSSELALSTTGTVQTSPVAATLEWTLTRLLPGERWPAVKLENAAGSGRLQMSTGANGYDGVFTLNEFAGRLNGYAVTANGSATLVDSQPVALLLQAQSGNNSLNIEGAITDTFDLRWQLQAPALAQLSPALRGRVQAEGEVSGTREAPAFAASVQAAAVALVNADSSFQLDSAALNLAGTAAAHQFTAELSTPQGSASLNARGAAAANGWRGTLATALVDSRYGRWQLQAPAALAYVDGNVSVAEHCWNMQDTSVCLQASKPDAQGISAELALTNLPLGWINNPPAAPAGKPPGLQELQDALALNLPPGLHTEGSVNLQLSVQDLQGMQPAAVDAVLDMQDMVLQLTRTQEPDTETAPDIERFALAVNRSELHYAAGRWQADFDIDVANALRGGVNLGNTRGTVSLADSGELGGSAAASFTDLNWLETLVPDLSQPSGRLDATLTLGGTRSEPLVQGQAQLQEGNVDLPAFGLEVRAAAFTLTPLADGSWQLVGSANSGAGMVSLLATMHEPFTSARTIDARLLGERVQTLNTSYAAVTLSPDLRLHYGASAIALEGSLLVDAAQIDLETVFGDAGGNAVPLSGDVTVVSGNDLPPAASTGTAVPMTLDVALKLGNDVQVRGYKLDASLTGELRIQQVPGRSLLVYGQLDIPSGSYEIYNQRLNTRDGNLAFFGNPANPTLDLRAFRTTSTAEVGVQLSGSLNSIQGELYSSPLLPADEILALLVTGKSLSAVNAQENTALIGAIASLGLGNSRRFGAGITERVSSRFGLESLSFAGGDTLEDSALGLGKYLTPDLLMRYKVGLFDRQSVLGIEYTLNEHLKLKVESGISQSVELSYTIEKD